MARTTKARKNQELAFARLVLDHPALEDVLERMDMSILKRFRSGTKDEREILNAMLDNEIAFMSELKTIVAENQDIKNK